MPLFISNLSLLLLININTDIAILKTAIIKPYLIIFCPVRMPTINSACADGTTLIFSVFDLFEIIELPYALPLLSTKKVAILGFFGSSFPSGDLISTILY